MMGNNAAFLPLPGLSHRASGLCTRLRRSHALSTDFSPGHCVTARMCPHATLSWAREHGQTPAPHLGTRTRPRGMLSLRCAQGTPAPAGWQGWSRPHPGTVTPALPRTARAQAPAGFSSSSSDACVKGPEVHVLRM